MVVTNIEQQQAFPGIFQVGKGKKWNFPGGEKLKLIGILPEKYTILRVKKVNALFLSKIAGGASPPRPTEKPWQQCYGRFWIFEPVVQIAL